MEVAGEGSAAAAAAAFSSMGMVVARGLLPAVVAQRAYTQATGSLAQLLAAIEVRGVELGVGTKAGWTEVVRRCVGHRACSVYHVFSSRARTHDSSRIFLRQNAEAV